MAREMSSKKQYVSDLLRELCQQFTGGKGNTGRTLTFCAGILGSQVQCSLDANELRVSERIQKRLARQGREKDAVLFLDMVRRLHTNGPGLNCCAILQLLLVLADDRSVTSTPVGLSSPMSSMQLITSLTRASSGIGSSQSDLSTQQSQSTLLATPYPPNYASTPATIKYSTATTKGEGVEVDLVRDLLYVFQGIDGQILRYDAPTDHFVFDQYRVISTPIRELCGKLAELGWLFSKVQRYIHTHSQDRAFGLVGQGFCAALEQEMSEYYRLIAVLEGQVNQSSAGLTLRRLVVWTYDPMDRLKLLATLISNCKGLKGGALVSTLYGFTQHGNPLVKRLVKQLLSQAYQPLNGILNDWIFEGELHDSFHEFFVSSGPGVPRERLWQEEYSLQHDMLPVFISRPLAQKILLIGKSINFLRLRCQDRSQLGDQSLRNWYCTENGLCSFDDLTGPSLQHVVDTLYQDSSKLLLHIFDTRYKFHDHLCALRRYLLLGQGDFIRYLMDQLEPELIKPATELFRHNLTGTLEGAVRATNAQYDDVDILQRLDVRILELSPGDCGWDVFSLDYHVDGPISTVFASDTMLQYLRVFNFLWRSKRMEHCLANMWRSQASYSLRLELIPELLPVLHQVHLLMASMIHFISQMQYYITFEVLECCWADLLKKIKSSPDLDHLISTHSIFLKLITTRCLLDLHSQPMLTQVRAIFDIIVEFQGKLLKMCDDCLREIESREEFDAAAVGRTDQGKWGSTGTESDREFVRRAVFVQKSVSSYRSQFTVLQRNYQDMVKELILQLDKHSDQSLRFLSSRLNFNMHYK